MFTDEEGDHIFWNISSTMTFPQNLLGSDVLCEAAYYVSFPLPPTIASSYR